MKSFILHSNLHFHLQKPPTEPIQPLICWQRGVKRSAAGMLKWQLVWSTGRFVLWLGSIHLAWVTAKENNMWKTLQVSGCQGKHVERLDLLNQVRNAEL